jgi:hypothetical protein
MRRSFILPVLLLAGLLAAMSSRPASAEHISDWMIMDVCTDAKDAIQPGIAPTDPACTKKRKIRPGETPPYRLRGWPANDGCHGVNSKWNMPVAKAGSVRIVSVTEETGEGCLDGAGSDDDSFKGASVQWFDAGYAFIMGSWSAVGLSSFESPLCQQAPASSHRFFRGWVIAPAIIPQPGVPSWGVFPSKLLAGKTAAPVGPCPKQYQRALTLWIMDDAEFRGMKLRAIVSHHFANTDPEGDGPGPAQQVERTYWTREFGLTRWEKWARDDWTHPRSHQRALPLAKTLFARGRCSTPFSLPAKVSPGLRTEPGKADDTYSQVFIDPRSGERHTWYMTLCDDWTNLLRSPPAAGGNRSASVDALYWRE